DARHDARHDARQRRAAPNPQSHQAVPEPPAEPTSEVASSAEPELAKPTATAKPQPPIAAADVEPRRRRKASTPIQASAPPASMPGKAAEACGAAAPAKPRKTRELVLEPPPSPQRKYPTLASMVAIALHSETIPTVPLRAAQPVRTRPLTAPEAQIEVQIAT